MANKKREYNVGYKKPPKHSRFKKGQSGNPRGRPKREQKTLPTRLMEAFNETVWVKINGQEVKMTKMDAAFIQLVNRAAAGDLRATKFLLEESKKANLFKPEHKIIIEYVSPDNKDEPLSREDFIARRQAKQEQAEGEEKDQKGEEKDEPEAENKN